MALSTRTVFEQLISQAEWLGWQGHHKMSLEMYRRKGEEIPDLYKPGGFLNRQTPEVREALKGVTSDLAAKYGPRL